MKNILKWTGIVMGGFLLGSVLVIAYFLINGVDDATLEAYNRNNNAQFDQQTAIKNDTKKDKEKGSTSSMHTKTEPIEKNNSINLTDKNTNVEPTTSTKSSPSPVNATPGESDSNAKSTSNNTSNFNSNLPPKAMLLGKWINKHTMELTGRTVSTHLTFYGNNYYTICEEGNFVTSPSGRFGKLGNRIILTDKFGRERFTVTMKPEGDSITLSDGYDYNRIYKRWDGKGENGTNSRFLPPSSFD